MSAKTRSRSLCGWEKNVVNIIGCVKGKTNAAGAAVVMSAPPPIGLGDVRDQRPRPNSKEHFGEWEQDASSVMRPIADE